MTRYDTYRRALRDELGADPGPALRQAHQELLAATSNPRSGTVSPTSRTRCSAGTTTSPPIANLLNTARVVSVVGPGGLGKTRLAHAVSLRRRHAGPCSSSASPVSRRTGTSPPRSRRPSGSSSSVRAPAGSAASPRRSAPARCSCSTTASTSSPRPPTWSPRSSPWPVTCGSSPPAARRSACRPSRSTRCRSSTSRRRRSCSASVPRPRGPASTCRPPRSPSCARASTGCRSRSSWPPPACGSCRSPRSTGGSRTGSRCCVAAAATRRNGTTPCTRSSTGAGTCSTRTARPRSGRSRCSPVGSPAEAADRVLGRDSFDTLEHLVDQSLLKVVDTPGRRRGSGCWRPSASSVRPGSPSPGTPTG